MNGWIDECRQLYIYSYDKHSFVRLRTKLFKQIFIKYPQSITKLVQVSIIITSKHYSTFECYMSTKLVSMIFTLQVIMLRLHKVIFLTLSQFLGLSKDLFVQVSIEKNEIICFNPKMIISLIESESSYRS